MKPHLKLTPAPLPGSTPGSGRSLAGKVLTTLPPGAASPTRVQVGADAGPCRQPQINVHQTGGEVSAIEVLCSCGERILIELKY